MGFDFKLNLCHQIKVIKYFYIFLIVADLFNIKNYDF